MLSRRAIDRINVLARKQRTAGLTAAEQAEQAELRRLYVDCIKDQVKTQLDSRFSRHPTGCRHDRHEQE